MKDVKQMTTLEKLNSGGAAYRLNGLVTCLDARTATEEEIAAIKRLKDDTFVLAGRPISAYAYAVLDVLGVESYQGDDWMAMDLIKAWK